MLKFSKMVAYYLISTLLLIEVVGLFIGDNKYFWLNRSLFISQDAFRSIGDGGLWTYVPDRTIETAATYHLSRFEHWLEYRCRFETNALGLIKTNADTRGNVDVLVLGDSFTEGHGGCPWLTEATLKDTPYTVMNGGLQSNGIADFELLEAWLSESVSIKELVIVAISNDFKRVPAPDRFNTEGACLKTGDCALDNRSWWGIDNAVTDKDLLAVGRKRYAAKGRSAKKQIQDTLTFRSFTYQLYTVFFHRFNNLAQKPSQRRDRLYQTNFDALARLQEKYPRLRVIMVPQKDEVGLMGRRNFDTIAALEFMDSANIPYKHCPLDRGDYMRIDGHPNADGYKKLFNCVTTVMNTAHHQTATPPN